MINDPRKMTKQVYWRQKRRALSRHLRISLGLNEVASASPWPISKPRQSDNNSFFSCLYLRLQGWVTDLSSVLGQSESRASSREVRLDRGDERVVKLSKKAETLRSCLCLKTLHIRSVWVSCIAPITGTIMDFFGPLCWGAGGSDFNIFVYNISFGIFLVSVIRLCWTIFY